MSAMKILLLNANRVGIGTYHRALNFGRELALRGHDVTMMTVSNTRKFRSHERLDRERFRVIECPNWLDELLPWHASGPIDIWLRIREVLRGGYDLVYAFEYQPNISLPVYLTRPLRRYTLMSDWCDWFAGGGHHFGGKRWAHEIDRFFEERIRHHADHVTTINRILRDRACSIGISADRTSIVGEGVDPSYIAPLDRDAARRRLGLPLQIPIVGTIRDSVRGSEVLCTAVAMSRVPDLHLLMVGSKTEPAREFARAHRIADRVITPGRVSDADLPYYLASADVLALPLEDNLVNRGRWPHKLGELLAAERPVLVSRSGEFPELLESRGCAVIVDFDAAAFARAIETALGDRAGHAAVAARGRHLIESEFNWHVIGNQLEAAVRKAVNPAGDLAVDLGDAEPRP
jgi:glycosyltransferase involved in cell wall biosynthesis